MASRGSVSPVEPSGRASPTTALGSAIEGLQDNTLTAIDIERRRIRDEGASALGAALLCNSSLSELIVADNGIGDEGAASLGTALEHHPTLQRLVLDKNSISDEGAGAIAAGLERNTALVELSLAKNMIGDLGASNLGTALKSNQAVQRLSLAWNSVGPVGASRIADALEINTSLRTLVLVGNSVGSEGAAALGGALQHNVGLTRLELNVCRVGDVGAWAISAGLERNSALLSVVLQENGIGDDGATALAVALGQNSSLRDLDIQNNAVTDKGASAIAAALEVNTTLHEVELGHNSISAGGAEALAAALGKNSTLQTLGLGWNGVGPQGASALGVALEHSAVLRSLNLSVNSIGGAGLLALGAALTTNTTLHTLDLGWNQLGDGGAALIGSSLQGNRTLVTLALHENNIGTEGAMSIAVAIALGLPLRTLDLNGNAIGGAGAEAIATALLQTTTLTVLKLNNNRIGDVGAQALGTSLEASTSLQSVHLQENTVGDIGAVALAAAVQASTALTSINLNMNVIGDEGVAALSHAVGRNHSIHTLSLRGNRITAVGIEFLNTRKLRHFSCDAHAFVWPPPAVSRNGLSAVYAFLDSAAENLSLLTRSRLMFVGGGGAGKTTLKTALLLRGRGTEEVVSQLRDSMLETIERKWQEEDLRTWIDEDLAHTPGFFDTCPKAAGLTGKRFLSYSHDDVATVFGESSETARRVVEKLVAVLCFLCPTKSRQDAQSLSDSLEWLTLTAESALARIDALFGTDLPGELDLVTNATDELAGVRQSYAALLDIPHVWTEGVELDGRWEDFTLWDFPGQMELYPAHRLFLACETAVYVMVVNGYSASSADCCRQLDRWLSLIRSGLIQTGSSIEARVVVTHLDNLTEDERTELCRSVHEYVALTFGEHFKFGEKCFATDYTADGGGDVDALRAELRDLRLAEIPRRPLPAQYQAACDQVHTLASEVPRWPIVPLTSIETHNDPAILPCLEDLGFIQCAGEDVILEPVSWLSRLMAAFLHPYHGVGRRVSRDATAAAKLSQHLDSVLLTADAACRIVNMRHKVVEAQYKDCILPLLAHFDVCFPLAIKSSNEQTDSTPNAKVPERYIFPGLLPRVDKLPCWLQNSFDSPTLGRRYVCTLTEDLIPATLASLLVKQVAILTKNLGGHPVFFGRGSAIFSIGESFVALHLTEDDRAVDVISLGADRQPLLSAACMHLAMLVDTNYRGLRLNKHRLARVDLDECDDFKIAVFHHPFLGSCRADALITKPMASARVPVTPEWLAQEYDVAATSIYNVSRTAYFAGTTAVEAWVETFRRDKEYRDGVWALLSDSAWLSEDLVTADRRDGRETLPRVVSITPEKFAAEDIDTVDIRSLTSLEVKKKLSDALDICRMDIAEYTLVWAAINKDETERRAIVELEEMLTTFALQVPSEEPSQPAIIDGCADTCSATYLDRLIASFEKVDPVIFEDAERVASSVGLRCVRGPRKKDARCLEKAKLAYSDDFSKLKDIWRASIVCPSMVSVVQLCRALVSDDSIKILRIKNRFARSYQAKEMSAGYRDVQFNLKVPGIGLVWELQVHLAKIQKLKSSLGPTTDHTGRTGHQRYKELRDVTERLHSGISGHTP